MMTFDELRGVVVLANGIQGNVEIFNDVWTYDGVDWTRVQAPTPLPTRLYNTAFAFDMSARRAFTVGGLSTDSAPFDDTWAWDGAWSSAKKIFSPSRPGSSSAMAATTGAGSGSGASAVAAIPTPTAEITPTSKRRLRIARFILGLLSVRSTGKRPVRVLCRKGSEERARWGAVVASRGRS
jgi:hypothetical protein